MSSYIITGKLGSGKSLVTVGKMHEYLLQGRKVATNLDIDLSAFMSPQSKKSIIRMPDKPTHFDMVALGSGNDSKDEEKNGLLVLDELGTWFNSRAWQDKTRAPLIDWFLHARKHGWDTMLLVQGIDMIDGQLREGLAEHLVICRRLDRLKIPFIGGLMQTLGMKGKLPKMHSAKVHYGDNENAMVADRWIYRGKQYYDAYDTKQVFSPTYPHGAYSLLSPWHLVGRFLPNKLSFWDSIKLKISLALVEPPRVVPLKPKNALATRIMKLPDPAQRMEFFRRFQACGSI